MDAGIGMVGEPGSFPAPGGGAPRSLRVAAVAAAVLFAVAMLGLMAAMEVHLTTTTAELATVQRSIGGRAGTTRPSDTSILGEMGQIGQMGTEIATMTGQVDQLAGALRTLSAGSGLPSLPALSAQLAALDRQLSAFGGQLSGVTSAVAPLSSIERSLDSLQATLAALERTLSPPGAPGTSGG